MANVSPTLTRSTTGYLNPGTDVFSNLDSSGGMASTEDISTIGTVVNRLGLKVGIWHFSAVGDTDTWDSSSTYPPPKKPVACFWCGDDVDVDLATAYVTSVGGPSGDAAIQFQTGGVGRTGWLLVFYQD